MSLSIGEVALLAAGCALGAVLSMFFRGRFAAGEGPEDLSDLGPRGMTAEFLGIAVGTFLVAVAFTAQSKRLEWLLIGSGAVVWLAGDRLAEHFARTTEVPETPDKEPTGFKSDVTDLNLK